MSTSDTPSPYVRKNGSSPTNLRMRLTRPPVIVLSPVSTTVTLHGSAKLSCTSIEFVCRSNVMSDVCRK